MLAKVHCSATRLNNIHSRADTSQAVAPIRLAGEEKTEGEVLDVTRGKLIGESSEKFKMKCWMRLSLLPLPTKVRVAD